MIKVAWAPIYHHSLPDNHRFPMAKYSLLPQQLLYEGTLTKENFFAPSLASEAQILRTHCPHYFKSLMDGSIDGKAQRKIGFPWSEQLIKRERVIGQGTINNVQFAIENGCSLNIAGGTHHAFYDRGEGFCMFNDIMLGAHFALDHTNITRILVIDLDVHQGNGTAAMASNDPRIFTFSMHGEKNYPYHKESSDMDLPLSDYIEDKPYLSLLNDALNTLFEKVDPELVFFQSGVDVLKSDKLGRMGLTLNGCKERDTAVISRCHERGIPLVINMGGGYSPEIKTIIEAHANTFRTCINYYQ
ncbi:MAG: histone deacetylase [Schleiferiaceae bacterium]|nr:histone deacetylase [Schleiferiaceae bacterium]